MAKPEGVPVEQVKTMRAQGMSDDKIVDALRTDGYFSAQIFDAITQAGTKIPDNEPEVTESFPEVHMPEVRTMQQTTPYDTNTEELIESIIDEKWAEIESDVQKIVTWKNDTEKKIKGLEEDFSTLKEQFDKLHQAIIGKIGDYDKNILNVGAEIKAMEKAFSKIIPDFAQSVTDLTELVEDLRKDKPKSSKKKK